MPAPAALDRLSARLLDELAVQACEALQAGDLDVARALAAHRADLQAALA